MRETARSFASFALAVVFTVTATSSVGVGQDRDKEKEPPGRPLDTGSEKPQVEHRGGDEFQLGDIRFNQKSREIILNGKVNMKVGFLEYVVVNETTGKLHESLLSATASPMHLNVVFLLLGYEPSDAVTAQKEDKDVPPQEKASFDVLVRWRVDGKEREAPVETWIHNLATESPANAGPWLYNGSKLDDAGTFAAETDGSILALYRDPRALANNPREGKFSDEIWKPSADVPEKETSIKIVFRPHPAGTKPAAARGNAAR